MEICLCWRSSLWAVVLLLTNVSAHVSARSDYSLSRGEAAFSRAEADCLPGVLPTVATQQELQGILQLLNQSEPLQANMTVWVGLRKPRSDCVIPSLPLRGFRWTENGGQELTAIDWLEEPKQTCTEGLCGALRRQVVQSDVRWGLIPDSCRSPYRFVCRGGRGQTGGSVGSGRTTVIPAAAERPLNTAPATTTPDPSAPRPSTPPPEPESCQHSKNPKHPRIRSLTTDPANSSRVLVECWSEVKVHLVCSGVPAVWRVTDGSPANLSTICQPCDAGFQKDASGLCVDVDECSAAGDRCPHSCLNTPGSYRCVCAAGQDAACQEEPAASEGRSLSHILVPVLTVVGMLLVALVIIAVVKCCLKRRKKKKMKTKP